MQKKPIITIWDVDKTLYDGYAIIDFGIYLEKINKFKPGFKDEILHAKGQYEAGKTSYEKFAESVYEIYGRYIYNLNMYEILQLSKTFWQKNIDKIYPAAKSLFQYLTQNGSEHAALSGSSFESLYYLADTLGFIKIKTTEYETIDGNYTANIVSKLVSHHDKSKVKDRVENQRNKYNLVVGVGDNLADSSFLERVDIAIVMGKDDDKLIKKAISNSWTIVEDKYDNNINFKTMLDEKIIQSRTK